MHVDYLTASVDVRPRPRALASADTRVVAAVSGGSDSVALAHLLRELDARRRSAARRARALQPSASRGGRRRRAVLRGAGGVAVRAALREPRRCRRAGAARAAFARRRRAHARATRSSSGRARTAAPTSSRSATRATIRRKPSCCGSCAAPGRAALASMHPRNGAVVRPLLDCRREELRDVATRAASCRSSTTSRTTMSASRATACGPSCCRCSNSGSTRRSSTSWPTRRRWRASTGRGRTAWPPRSRHASCVRCLAWDRNPCGKSTTATWRSLPLALRRAVLRRTMTDLAAPRPMSLSATSSAALRLTDQLDDGRVDAPGQRLERIGSRSS